MSSIRRPRFSVHRLGAALALCLTPTLAGASEEADLQALFEPRPVNPTPGLAPGLDGGPGLAIQGAKILTVAEEGPAVIDRGLLLVRDGKIEAVGVQGELEIPEGYVVEDVGERWLMPGMIELHNHIGSGFGFNPNDINDTVFLANPGLRASCGVRPDNPLVRRGVAAGVTSALYIPGSGSNIGGHGVLLKLGRDKYEDMEIRNPGSMKLAQAGNPERWTTQPGRAFQNWNTKNTFRRGLAYGMEWRKYEAGEGEKPERNLQFEIFRHLLEKRTQVSTHTQVYQVVLRTVTMLGIEFEVDGYIDHGSFDGYRTAPLAEKVGIDAILGPRAIAGPRTRDLENDGKIVGMAAMYQKGGHTNIGFNTDCVDNGVFITPPQEELPLQAAMAKRYGLDDSNMEGVRGLTLNPAKAAGIDHRVGSLEAGKDADIVVISGDPADPRAWVSKVWTDGVVVYDEATEPRRW